MQGVVVAIATFGFHEIIAAMMDLAYAAAGFSPPEMTCALAYLLLTPAMFTGGVEGQEMDRLVMLEEARITSESMSGYVQRQRCQPGQGNDAGLHWRAL